MKITLTAVFQEVPGGYVGFVEELPGANTQGATLEQTRANLEEVITLVLEANRSLAEEALGNQPVLREAITLSASGLTPFACNTAAGSTSQTCVGHSV